MSPKFIILILFAGLTSGVLFCSSAFSSGIFFVYLPLLPLLLIGLSHGVKPSLQAAFFACLTVTLIADIGNALFYIGFIVLPAFIFLYKALLHRNHESAIIWHPILPILAELTITASALFMMLALVVQYGLQENLQTLLSHEITGSMEGLDPNIASILKWLTGDGSFLLFAAIGWSWVLMLYLFATIANGLLTSNLLTTRNWALRPSLRLSSHGLPPILLALTAISGAFAFFGQTGDRFAGEAVFLILLLPYFLSGITLIHHISSHWRGRMIWLVLVYASLMLLLWPALIAIGAGIYVQIAEMLDRQTKIG